MPFNLNAVIDEDEARAPYEFTWDGETYTLPPVRDMRAVGAIAVGDIDRGLSILFGAEQWSRIQASPSVFSPKKMRALFDDYGKHIDGLAMGESSASSPASSGTAGPSKRTSKGTTRGSRSGN